MLMQRLITALVLIPCVVMALFFLPLPYFSAVIILVCGLAMWEWTQFLGIKRPNMRGLCALIGMIVLAVMTYFIPFSWFNNLIVYSLELALVWWLVALILVITYPKTARIWQNSVLLKSVFGFCTIFPFFTSLLALRSLLYIFNPYIGAFWVLYVLVLVWATDSGAYFAGRFFGKHKLAPHVSPGKTVEGFIGGVLTSVIIATIVMLIWGSAGSFRSIMVASIVAILASVLGDLTESMFKRAAGIKDSGHLIPGHGGVLDRIDSITAAMPVFVGLLFAVLV
ncbi:phosphatidate cytidylyltransferase [Utexia brackfieldae]|uniref:phosphatidate cytidylyltransferase n=1 Tax=Utexia brackfieldae TaxID=3074108 RepID=UPI00370D45CC